MFFFSEDFYLWDPQTISFFFFYNNFKSNSTSVWMVRTTQILREKVKLPFPHPQVPARLYHILSSPHFSEPQGQGSSFKSLHHWLGEGGCHTAEGLACWAESQAQALCTGELLQWKAEGLMRPCWKSQSNGRTLVSSVNQTGKCNFYTIF